MCLKSDGSGFDWQDEAIRKADACSCGGDGGEGEVDLVLTMRHGQSVHTYPGGEQNRLMMPVGDVCMST
jgi:hypothetical protein